MCFTSFFTRFKQGLYLQKKSFFFHSLPFDFAHISDLHFDGTGKLPTWVRHSIYHFLANYPFQLLCVTGDIIDKDPSFLNEALYWLNSLPVNYILLSLGNHDKSIEHSLLSLSLNYPKIKVLINDNFYYHNITFFSLTYPSHPSYLNGIQTINSLSPSSNLNFVLAHDPNSFLQLSPSSSPLHFLSGHTHGGQIAFADFFKSFFLRFSSFSNILNFLNIQPEHDCFQLQGTLTKNNSTLFINNGLATHPPARLFCPPMISLFYSC